MGSKKAERTEPTNQPASDETAIANQELAAASREPGEDAPERKFTPEANPRPWVINNQAGVEFRTHREPYEAELAFKEKPSQRVIDYMKESGFIWNGQEKIWTHPIGFKTQAQDRLVASRTYKEVVNMILKEKGLEPASEPEIAF